MRRLAALVLLPALIAGFARAAPGGEAPGKDAAPKDAASKDAAPKDAPATPAPEPWVRQVHAIVVRAMATLSRSLPRGSYAVHFSIDEQGRGSRYGVEGNIGAAQEAVITGALAARSFPAPPDGASHAMRFTVTVK